MEKRIYLGNGVTFVDRNPGMISIKKQEPAKKQADTKPARLPEIRIKERIYVSDYRAVKLKYKDFRVEVFCWRKVEATYREILQDEDRCVRVAF